MSRPCAASPWTLRRHLSFEEALDGSHILIKVVPGQAGNAALAETMLSLVNSSTINPHRVTVQAFAIAPYFGGGLNNELGTGAELYKTMTADDVLDVGRKKVVSCTHHLVSHRESASSPTSSSDDSLDAPCRCTLTLWDGHCPLRRWPGSLELSWLPMKAVSISVVAAAGWRMLMGSKSCSRRRIASRECSAYTTTCTERGRPLVCAGFPRPSLLLACVDRRHPTKERLALAWSVVPVARTSTPFVTPGLNLALTPVLAPLRMEPLVQGVGFSPCLPSSASTANGDRGVRWNIK